MANPQAAELAAALRMLPSTDELLLTTAARDLQTESGRRPIATLARLAIQSVRTELAESISGSSGHAAAYSEESLLASAVDRMRDLWTAGRRERSTKVINATGVVIHTNLGRAPLSPDVIRAIENAAGYCNLEYDIVTGKRGRRGARVEQLLMELTGAESAIVVNNCAAAAFLVLKVLADGGEVIVSRGELVEIGGDFRIPDVLSQSGATLREVGTTNRTKLSDYERSVSENTRLLMRVHPSNYKIVGFTETPSLTELADLADRKGILLYEDAGSGALLDLSRFGLSDEPVIGRSISDGAHVVTFSGDKLLGGSQGGLIVGRRDLIERIRKHPLYRALRVDKLIYAVLESTLEKYLREEAEQAVPVLRMIGMTNDAIEARARDLSGRVNEAIGNESYRVEIIQGESVIGGGSAPELGLKTTLLAIRHLSMSAAEIEEKLRRAEVPVVARIENDAVLIDLRTVDEGDEPVLMDTLVLVLS